MLPIYTQPQADVMKADAMVITENQLNSTHTHTCTLSHTHTHTHTHTYTNIHTHTPILRTGDPQPLWFLCPFQTILHPVAET